jgi:hypothetical protein
MVKTQKPIPHLGMSCSCPVPQERLARADSLRRASSTSSLAETILNYRELHGRTYHKYGSSTYV